MGIKLKAIRVSKGLTAKYVAYKLGITPSQMCLRENDKCAFTARELCQLVKLYDIDLREIF